MDNFILNYKPLSQKKTPIFRRISDMLLLPQIVRIEANLYGIVFRIMKLLPAKYIIEEALKRGDIKQNFTIAETSSGTFALGLAIVCAELGLPFMIFSDPAMDQNLLLRLKDLGGDVSISRNPEVSGSYQRLRLEALHNYLNRNKLSFWTQQYDNYDNARSYLIVAELILNNLGNNTTLVGAVGSGGSTCGIVRPLREVNPSVKLIGVDTFNSVLFGQLNGQRIIRGLGNSVMPKNLDHCCYDQIHWLAANDVYYYTRLLHKKYALFCGPTTGAAYQVAKYFAEQNPQENYAFISPDEGYRYADTVYNDNWLSSQSYYSSSITTKPIEVSSPLQAKEPWSYLNWARRSYSQVLGHDFIEKA